MPGLLDLTPIDLGEAVRLRHLRARGRRSRSGACAAPIAAACACAWWPRDGWALDGVRDLAERLRSPRERRRLASGLRAAADAGKTGAQISMMVDPARAGDVGDRLTALAEAFSDPLVAVSAPAAAVCGRLLCDAAHSPLYNPHIPETDLGRVLDLLERELSLVVAPEQRVA